MSRTAETPTTPPFELTAIENATSVGAAIERLDVSHPMDQATFDAVEAAIDTYSVVAVRGQMLAPADMLSFAKRFGTPQINARAEDHVPGFSEMTFISNVLENGTPHRLAGRRAVLALGPLLHGEPKPRYAAQRPRGTRKGRRRSWGHPLRRGGRCL